MPCCVDNCQRCAAHFGGFKFPWLGLWNSRGFVLPPDVAPNEAWDYYYQYQESMDLLLVAAYTNFTSAPDVVRQELYALQLRCSAGDAGQLGLGEVFDQWRTWCAWAAEILPTFVEPRLYPRAPRGPTLASLGTRRSSGTSGALRLAGAKVQVLSSLGQPASTVGILQGASAGRAAWGCVVPASLGGSYAGTLEDVGRCFWRGGSSGFAAASFCFPRLSYTVRVQCHGIRRQKLLRSASSSLFLVRGVTLHQDGGQPTHC